jgi:hypothetical protein
MYWFLARFRKQAVPGFNWQNLPINPDVIDVTQELPPIKGIPTGCNRECGAA